MRNKGFTLVEVLIVVAIIGILFSVGLPSYMHRCTRYKSIPCEVERTRGDKLERYQGKCDVCAEHADDR